MNELGIPSGSSRSADRRGPGKTWPTKATSYRLATVMRAWISGSHASGSQAAEAIPAPSEPLGPVALGGEDEVALRALWSRHRAEADVRVDGPPGAGSQVGRQVIPESVIDIEKEISNAAEFASSPGRKCSTSTNRRSARRQ